MELDTPIPNCPTHSLPFTYICAANQWHFVPLCQTCVIDHSKLHTKSKHTMILVGINQVLRKSNSMKQQFQLKFKEKMNAIDQIKKSSSVNILTNKLEEWKGEAVRCIQRIVDTIKVQIHQKSIQKVREYQKQLQIAHGIMLSQAERLQKMTSQLNCVEDFDAIKLVYFKDDTELYFQEVDDAIKQFELATNKNNLDRVNFKSITHKISDIIDSQLNKLLKDDQIQSQHSIVQKIVVKPNLKVKANPTLPAKVPKAATTIAYPKLTTKPKICQQCGSELQYLTNLKKHLICKNCGSNQRNYTKK